jgi:DNA polymerase III epsilon subunit-like protein
MHLFFDTETTGVPKSYKAAVTDLNNWPRLVQVAWLITDDEGNELKAVEYIIRPNGFAIPQEASRIHGITTENALQNGYELLQVMQEMVVDISNAGTLIAHNISFDEKIIGAELIRVGLDCDLTARTKKCTMQSSTNFCKIPGPYGYKWPRLDELHMLLFKHGFNNAHSALADVVACSKCYFELKRLGVMT